MRIRDVPMYSFEYGGDMTGITQSYDVMLCPHFDGSEMLIINPDGTAELVKRNPHCKDTWLWRRPDGPWDGGFVDEFEKLLFQAYNALTSDVAVREMLNG